MKLTVGRIVHAYRVREDSRGVEKRGPYAAILVDINSGGALFKVLSASPKCEDYHRFMDTEENTVYRYKAGGEGWLWRWPPREDDAKPAAKTEHESGCTGLCRGCCP